MTSQTHPIRAAFWMIGAIVSFSSMAIAGREINLQLDTFEIMMYRSLIGLVVLVCIVSWMGKTDEIKRSQMGLHVIRNIGHFVGQNLWFYALTLIPLAHLFAFEFSVPIWVTLAAPFLLAERLSRVRMLSIFIGFVGILIVTRPWSAGISTGIIAAALCAIGFAVAIIYTKKLTQTQTITNILFWMTAIQLVFGIICAGYDGDIALPTPENIPWITVIGIAGLVAHLCLTTALKLAPATFVMPIDFTRLPIIAIIGMLFYNEPLDLLVILGALIIFSANYLNIWSETRKKQIA
ncbi:DMT family transporter [Amylibacter sp. SFDW26]|uniref:DMT family transporter n=1 Tax=Amylibacter sp. SFDW26 TaxID=2652722 RepID=UPI001D01701D|nr:DMT family transporter [Amylibacter sp. SFDW26]